MAERMTGCLRWGALEWIANQIGPLIRACVSGVGNISCGRDIEVLSGSRGEDPVHLPVADDIIDKPVSGCESPAGANGKLVDSVGCEYLRDILTMPVSVT
jgi:hypothetical protein